MMRLLLTVVVLSTVGPAAARPCATVAVENALRNNLMPHLAVQERPYEPDLFLDSALYGLRVHYPVVEAEEIATEVLGYLEDAYATQVGGMGFAPPPPDAGRGGSDAFDLYLTGLAGVGALTLADDDEDDADGRVSRPSHLQLDPNVNEIEAFVAHEFQHALQFGTDGAETLMFFESSAVYQELSAYPDSMGYRENIKDFQVLPNLSIFSNGIEWADLTNEFFLYEYGAGLFIAYLDEIHGNGDGTFIRQLWDGSIQADDVMDNEPDWMDAFATETGQQIQDVLIDFASWRTLVGPRAVAGDGPSFGDMLTAEHFLRTRALAQASLDGTPINGLDDDDAPFHLGCSAFSARAPSMRDQDLVIEIESLADPVRPLGLTWIVDDNTTFTRVLHDQRGPSLSVTVGVPAGEAVTFVACDVGEADADDPLTKSPIELRLTDQNAPVADAGPIEPEPNPEPAPEPEPEPIICGCQQALPDGGPFGEAKKVLFPLMLLAGLVMLVIRGRRASRRKRSYQGTDFQDTKRATQPEQT